jgi:hypothetical protein
MMSVDGLSQQMSRLRLVALGALPGSGRDTVALPVGLLPFLLLHRGTPQPTTCPVRSRATPNAALFQVWPTACGGPTCARRCCSAPQEGRRGSCTACRRSSCRARTTARCYQRRRGVVPCSVAGAPPAVAATASPRLAPNRAAPPAAPASPALSRQLCPGLLHLRGRRRRGEEARQREAKLEVGSRGAPSLPSEDASRLVVPTFS